MSSTSSGWFADPVAGDTALRVEILRLVDDDRDTLGGAEDRDGDRVRSLLLRAVANIRAVARDDLLTCDVVGLGTRHGGWHAATPDDDGRPRPGDVLALADPADPAGPDRLGILVTVTPEEDGTETWTTGVGTVVRRREELRLRTLTYDPRVVHGWVDVDTLVRPWNG